jgi:asparagine synthase (glutamine-hydrolysing)
VCGIAGIFNYADAGRPVDRDLLTRMTRTLAHRGPDGEGFFVEGPVGFGHRRLAIVDLSPTGAQPMESARGVLTYNGEIYNHAALRGELEGPFRGRSDTETLLGWLDAAKPLERLNGIFAFAHWSRAERTLRLVRDQMGVKQLYYFDDGERLLFASEMKALLHCSDLPREIDLEAVNQYLHFHTPLFERTFVRQVKQVRPGEELRIDLRGPRARRYFSIDRFGGGPADAAAKEELGAELSQVVRDQLMSDVPVGSFFSGGIDSSAVAAFATKNGTRPRCYGVHFPGGEVIDERPYQEAAAGALGLDLQLTTYDPKSFADDLPKLIYQQDQPVIGAAMFPMWQVAKLAGSQVKVCLGGQGADEIFGGYARYALSHPLAVARGVAGGEGGNLRKDLRERRTLKRLLSLARRLGDWREAYFANLAQVGEAQWREVLEPVSRESCREVFRDFVDASPARDPADKVMHWDASTYLPGLFQQDDRMSMAHSLESRVPLADPRLVRFAFRLSFDQKFRGGSSKWMLRQAVADVLPREVLQRRKVGFDTPAEAWMRGPHRGFVRETLLSSRARARGLFRMRGLEKLLDDDGAPHWYARAWKLLCIEAWACAFLDPSPQLPEPRPAPHEPRIAAAAQEAREVGLSSLAFRARWELESRTGVLQAKDALHTRDPEPGPLTALPLPAPDREALLALYSPAGLARLESTALQAANGRILAFSHLPIELDGWHRDPLTGRKWPRDEHWSRALAAGRGDPKLVWEAARFGHFFAMTRAAVLLPQRRDELVRAMAAQIRGFVEENPQPRGIHWASGQEIALRLLAWLFAHSALREAELEALLPKAIAEGALHIERHFEFVERSVSNNHLISEALGLLLASLSLPKHPRAAAWRATGMRVLTEQAPRQIAEDGSSLQESHNYERAVVELYLFAVALLGREAPSEWRDALRRAVVFLHAHQEDDGRLPNHGPNDGSRTLPLSQCDFADFRPTLQAASLDRRLYPPGPWDEEALWLFGKRDLPLRPDERASISFPSGFSVLRNRTWTASFRSGTVRERFGHLDQLHLDVNFRGCEIAVDGGSHSYASRRLHDHFQGTASHNTVQIDGREQMVRQRHFSSVFRTRARLLEFGPSRAAGEHYGWERIEGGLIHRRAIFLDEDRCVVEDTVEGSGRHEVRLQWLCAPWPHRFDGRTLILQTPSGACSISLSEPDTLEPGLISRRYLDRVAAPSLVVRVARELPLKLTTTFARVD